MPTSERVFHTPLQIDQCQKRLRLSLHERGAWIRGRVEGNQFYCWERFSTATSLMPRLHGVLQPNTNGTYIHVKFEQEQTMYKFIVLIGSLFLLLGVWIAFTDLIGTSTMFRDNIEYVPQFVAMLIFVIVGNLAIACTIAEPSKKKLLEHMRQTLIAIEHV